MTPPLPSFRYHPDPVGTGSVVASDTACRCCGQARGFTYVGPVYSSEELDEELCPWCIADGSAAAGFDAEFTDVSWGVPDGVRQAVLDEIASRTPSFIAWQQERWLFHCGDAATFLGRAGFEEVEALPDALQAIRDDIAEFGWPENDVQDYLHSLDREGDVTAYLFRCLHCGRHLAYSDVS